ncbi:MAG: TIGR03936 family radical SAM-associated protein [Clostridia bacterium]|nr:TIGR03936 family radical SAM-associated protein [Clostridia bacterium]
MTDKIEYPMLPEPRTVRLRFKKTGALQYISHLDLQRSFIRILARAELPLWFTQGFNPHPKLVFALPLAIGTESVCELADIRIERDMPCDEILKRLGTASSGGLEFTDCYVPSAKFAEITGTEYTITLELGEDDAKAFSEKAFETLTSSPIVIRKRTKSGEKEVDISGMISRLRIDRKRGNVTINAVLSAGEGNTLNPENLLDALRAATGLPDAETEYSCMRLKMLCKDGAEFR